VPAERAPRRLASALNAFLAERVARVAARWDRGEDAPLDLAPLHVAGSTRKEGGGLLYHRPAHPGTSDDPRWSFDPTAPRRFDPRTLPTGLVQLAGHTGHRKCVEELGPWVTPEAAALPDASLRTLWSDGADVSYLPGVEVRDGAALVLLDAGMDRAPEGQAPLLPLRAVEAD
ncbi:MAG: hypothetical protein ACK4N5_00630, partial [Myxococcales bacterium]